MLYYIIICRVYIPSSSRYIEINLVPLFCALPLPAHSYEPGLHLLDCATQHQNSSRRVTDNDYVHFYLVLSIDS